MEKLSHREMKGHRAWQQGFKCKRSSFRTTAILGSPVVSLKGPQITWPHLLLNWQMFILCILRLILNGLKQTRPRKTPLPHFPLCPPIRTSAFVCLSSPPHLTTTKDAAELPSNVNYGKYQVVWNPRSYWISDCLLLRLTTLSLRFQNDSITPPTPATQHQPPWELSCSESTQLQKARPFIDLVGL